MDGHTFLSWNLPNLLSVWIILALGAALVMGLKQLHEANNG